MITDSITDDVWEAALAFENKEIYWINDWWHCKLYEYSGDDPSKKMKIFGRDKTEVPEDRDIFYPAPEGRFAPADVKVTYLTSNHEIGMKETIPELKNDDARFSRLQEFYKNKEAQDLCLYIHHIRVKLKKCKIADLVNENAPIMKHFKREGDLDAFRKKTFDKYKKSCSRQLAESLKAKGFDGIIYKSIRHFSDMATNDEAIIIWNEKCIELDNRLN